MAYTPFNDDEDIGKENMIIVCSDAENKETAIDDIDQWAYIHGYTSRTGENQLNFRRNLNGHKYFYSACYLTQDEGSRHKECAVTLAEQVTDGRDKNTAPPSSATLMREQTAVRGAELYESYVRLKIEADNFGKYVSMDVRANVPLDYEIGTDQISTVERIMDRRPDAILYTVRIGYPAVATLRRWFGRDVS